MTLSPLGGDRAVIRPFAAVSIPARLHRPYGVLSPVRRIAPEDSRSSFSSSTERSAAGGAEPAIDPEDQRLSRMRLEAVLLLAKTPLTSYKLSQLAHLADATEARTLVRQLNQTYDRLGRAIRIEQVAGGYRMLTRPALAPWLARLGHLPPPIRLSTPMMETLAVVAYRQPVSRASAEAVRGVACGELLRQLMDRELVRIVGRSEELGRPYLYGTTKRFLQLFGLPNLHALPPIEWNALREASAEEEWGSEKTPSDESSSTSTKEPVVSSSVASVTADTDPLSSELVDGSTEMAVAIAPSADPSDPSISSTADPPVGNSEAKAPENVIEDDEEEGDFGFYDDDEDDADWDDDDWDDDDLDDEEDDLDEDEDLDEEDLDEEEIDEDDLDEESWEEVDDSDDDDDDVDDEDWDDEEWDDEDAPDDDEEEEWE